MRKKNRGEIQLLANIEIGNRAARIQLAWLCCIQKASDMKLCSNPDKLTSSFVSLQRDMTRFF